MFACLYIPDFSIQAAVRNEGYDLNKQPVAIFDGPESLSRIFAVNEAARCFGIESGMTKLQAEACPGILLRKRSVEREASSQAALLDCASCFSPRFESTAPGAVIADIVGTEQLLGSPQEIGAQLAERARECGFMASVGIAANPDTALHAARGFAGISIIPRGTEARGLAGLPIEILQPPAEILDVLDSWGIRKFGALATLPPVALVERLGQAGLTLQRLARGEVHRELVPVEPSPTFQESMELEESVELLEPLAFVLNRLLEQVTARLRARSLATDEIRIVLNLEIHQDRQLQADACGDRNQLFVRELKLPVPTQEGKVLLKLLQLDLAAHPPTAPVKKVTLTATPAQIRVAQAGLFAPLAPEPGELEIALARLRTVVGEQDSAGRQRVGSPSIVDSHRADNFQMLPFRSEISGHIRECPSSPRLALRMFRPPLPAKVEMSHETPSVVIFNGVKAKVLTAAGPWSSGSAWWNKREHWRREEWDLSLSSDAVSGLYRFFRDVASGYWFVEGMYD
jgi:protein ImuB